MTDVSRKRTDTPKIKWTIWGVKFWSERSQYKPFQSAAKIKFDPNRVNPNPPVGVLRRHVSNAQRYALQVQLLFGEMM